jgi:REP element-mobilizing transposase RayT
MPDHVHLLSRLHAQASISDTLRDLKSNSSGWIHDTFPAFRGFAWQTGYAAFSVSYSGLGDVRAYIERQEEHHHGMDFKKELIALLDRHEIEYDPRYIFD